MQPETVLGIHPVPLFCDADCRIPSATLSPEQGPALRQCQGKTARLQINSRTTPTTGYNVLALSPGLTGKKVVIGSHYDTWFDTPGAIDNAAGVTALLALAEMLVPEDSCVELVAFNGEDYYSAPGQVLYLQSGTDDIAFGCVRWLAEYHPYPGGYC